MKIIEQDANLKKSENRKILKKIAKERGDEAVLNNFRKSRACKIVMNIIDEEIEKAADVRTIPSDAKNLTETAKLLIINQRALIVLENIKKRIKA